MPSLDKDPLLGRTIAQRYRLIAQLGAGGMATVYLARHVLIDRLSAIKIVPARSRSDPRSASASFAKRARSTASTTPTSSRSPTTARPTASLYLVMEYVPGESLQQAPRARAARVAPRGRASGSRSRRRSGARTRWASSIADLKPANILLVARRDGGDLVKLTDFGVAKLVDAPTAHAVDVALGTPGYFAPEYCEFGSLDARSDLFSLGVVLYEATSGALPFDERAFTRGPPFPTQPPMRLGEPSARRPRVLRRRRDDAPRAGSRRLAARRIRGRRSPEARARSRRERATAAHRSRSALGGGVRSRLRATWPDRGSRRASRRGARGLTSRRRRSSGSARSARARSRSSKRTRTASGSSMPAGTLVALAQAKKQVAMVDADCAARRLRQRGPRVGARAAVGRSGRARRGSSTGRRATTRRPSAGRGPSPNAAIRCGSRRASGEHPVPAVEAMVWEQAALDQEEETDAHPRGRALGADAVASRPRSAAKTSAWSTRCWW